MASNKPLIVFLLACVGSATFILTSATNESGVFTRDIFSSISAKEALSIDHIASNISLKLAKRQRCNLVIVSNPEDPFHTKLADSVKSSLSRTAMVTLNFAKNFSYFSPILDRTVQWTSTCSDYIVLLTSMVDLASFGPSDLVQETNSVMEDMEFVIKIAGRDRQPSMNVILEAEFWTVVKNRLRNFPEVCLFAADVESRPSECRTSTESSLSGGKLRITGFPTLPAVVWENLPDGKITGDGVDFLMVKDFARRFNFTFSLEPPMDGFWGHMGASGVRVFGMTGQVAHGEADLAIGDFFQMYALSLAADYPLYSRGCTAISVPNPARYEVWKSVSNIFAPGTWLVLLAANVVPFIFKWLPQKGIFARNYGPKKRAYEWTEHLRIFLDTEPWEAEFAQESLPTRLVINGFAMFALFITNVFEAGFFGKLTAPQYYDPIGNLDDLVATKLPIRMNSLYTFLVDAYPQHKAALEKMGSPDVPFNLDEALKLVVAGKAATVEGWHETIFAQGVRFSDALGNNPQFHVIDRCFMPANAGWVTPKHSYYGESFSAALQKMNEGGLIDKYRRDVMDRARLQRIRDAEINGTGVDESLHLEESALIYLTMTHMNWVFVLYGIGNGLAMIAFLYEMCRTPTSKVSGFVQVLDVQ